jgi:hypothetical protein
MHGILSGTWYFKKMKELVNLVNNVPDPRLLFTPPYRYLGKLPNSHGRTLTDDSYVTLGILSGTAALVFTESCI